MLQKMRQFSKSWVSNLILGVLTLAFISWGIGDIFRGNVSTAVATVGRTGLEQSEFQRDYTNFMRNQGKDLTPQQARAQNLGYKLLQQDISRMALDNLADRLSLTASDADISTQIRAIPSFAGINGTFDRATFEQAINQLGYSEKGFVAMIQRGLVRDQLIRATEGGFAMPPGYARAIFAYTTQVRAADYVVLDAKALAPIAPPPDAVLEAYLKQHPGGFSTPEYRDVTYAEIGPDDVSAGVSVSETQIQNAYESRKDEYVIPEKRTLEQIVFPSEAEAKAARAKIDAGASFAQIAFARGVKPADLSLGEVAAADLDAGRAKAAFAAPPDGVTQPVKFTFGWAMLHVVKIAPGKTTTLDQVRAQLTAQLQQQLAQSKLDDIANAYTDASSGGASLTAAAQKVGMHTGHVAAIDAAGLAPDGSKTAAPDDPQFRAAVFKAEVGEEGDPFETKAGHYYVVSVNGVLPPKLKPLGAVRAQVLAAWTDEQRAMLLHLRAAELAAQAGKDGSLAGVAKAIGASVQTSAALGRQTSNDTFSPELVGALFDAMPGATVYGPAGKGGAYVVARVSGVYHPLPPLDDPRYAKGAQMISEGIASDIVEAFAYAERDKQGVKINNKLLSDVIGGEGS